MTSQQSLVSHAIQIRRDKRQRIYKFFEEHIGQRFPSSALHATFGTAFRSRVSDINNDPSSKITINNRRWIENNTECSEYYAEKRP